ncbi:unnamed protein product [Sphagnum tenellum]
MLLDLSMPDVEEASGRDSERLVRIAEGYKAKSVHQGAVEKLAELALDKLSATTSDPGHLQSIEYDDVQLAGFLGKRSAGSVFECRFHGQMAAAKIFTSSNSKNAEKEEKLQARLRHPNVVQFIGHAVKQNQHIIVKEFMNMDLRRYVEENVREILSRPPLSLLLVVDIILQLAKAMNCFHKSRVMHRDLKSSNVLTNAVMSNSENLFQGPRMIANISAGDFSETIADNDVQLKIEYPGQGGYACVFKCQLHGEMAAAKLFNTSNTIEVKAVKNKAKLLASLEHPNVVQFVGYAVKENQHYIITELMSKDLQMYRKENVPLSLPLAVDSGGNEILA